MPVRSDFLVLNSVSLAKRSLDIPQDYRIAFIYRDRDEVGKRLLEKYQTSGLNCVDASDIYRNYKDLNELVANKSAEKQIKKQQNFKKSGGLHL